MNLVTEDMMKKIVKGARNSTEKQIKLPRSTVLTPAAQSVLSDSKLQLVFEDKESMKIQEKCAMSSKEENISSVMQTADKAAAKNIGRFQLKNGGFIDEKPEHMTQLFGNTLVFKDNKIIKLRGEVDILMSEIMKVQIVAEKNDVQKLAEELQRVCDYIGELQKSEILDQKMRDISVIELNYDEIREMSHHPQKYFGREHLFNITYKIGEIAVLLNALRALVRKAEIACYEAFKNEDGSTERQDLVQGFNRLSSVLYIITFRYLTKQYER